MRRPPATAVLGLLLGLPVQAQVPDWHRLPTLTSSASKGLAYDFARRRMVLFESNGWVDVSRTWEWVADAWSLRRTATAPPPRQDFAFGYDPMRERFVLFGGSTRYDWSAPGAALADTWEYDGVDWVQRFPTASPPAQVAAWLGFDFANWMLLLCGGVSTQPLGSWHYDGTTWIARPVAPFQAPATAIASDPSRLRIVAVTTHFTSLGQVRTTREWDGSSWQQIGAASLDLPRYGNLAFVAQRGTVVLNGPAPAGGAPGSHLWEWDGAIWSPIATGAPLPFDRVWAHDPVRNRTFALSTSSSQHGATETVQWDGTTWSRQVTSLGWELLGNAAYDPVRQRTIALVPAATIEWDGANWQRGPRPPGLTAPIGVAFDEVRARTVAVGAVASGAVHTWEHDGVAWSAAAPSPQLLMQPAGWLVYHGGSGKVVCVTSTALHEWDGTAWNPIGPGHGQGGASAVYDAGRNQIVVPGAFSGGTLATHTWNGTAWTMHVPVSAPPPRLAAVTLLSLGYDEARQRVVLFGGRSMLSAFTFLDDLWEWDGANWSQRALAHSPPAREGAAIVFDRARQQLLMLGGRRNEDGSPHLLFADVWALDAAAPATVTTLGPGCGGANAVPALVPSAPHPGAPAFTLDLHSPLPSAPCVFLFALANASVSLGAGCTLFAPAPEAVAFTITDQNGLASTHTAIPLALQGFSFSAQAGVLDATSPLGFATTPGLRIVVGR